MFLFIKLFCLIFFIFLFLCELQMYQNVNKVLTELITLPSVASRWTSFFHNFRFAHLLCITVADGWNITITPVQAQYVSISFATKFINTIEGIIWGVKCNILFHLYNSKLAVTPLYNLVSLFIIWCVMPTIGCHTLII